MSHSLCQLLLYRHYTGISIIAYSWLHWLECDFNTMLCPLHRSSNIHQTLGEDSAEWEAVSLQVQTLMQVCCPQVSCIITCVATSILKEPTTKSTTCTWMTLDHHHFSGYLHRHCSTCICEGPSVAHLTVMLLCSKKKLGRALLRAHFPCCVSSLQA